MAVQQIDSYFAEDLSSIEQFELTAGDDVDASAIAEMFDRFLTPNWEEYLSLDVGTSRVKAPTRCCSTHEHLQAEQLTEELMKSTIDLALATLEAAESALFAKLMLE
jgi:hypothetical protein